MANKPRSIIFVPGSFQTSEYYHHIIDKLEASKYPGRLISLSLPSNGAEPGSPATKGISPDIEVIEAAIAEEVLQRQSPVLLVAHSYGSVPAACALKQFADANMVRFLIVCGLMVKLGESVYTYCPEPGKPPPIHKVKDDFILCDEEVITLFNEVLDDERQYAIKNLMWQAMAPSKSPTTFEGWAAVPTTYLVASKDQAIIPAAQDIFIANARERGADVTVVTLETGHTPMLSKPDELTQVIMKCLERSDYIRFTQFVVSVRS